MNYDIDVENLDGAYVSCKEINDLASLSGKSLIEKMDSNIIDLTNDWHGSDATNHINGIIDIYNALLLLVGDAKVVTYNAGNSIINIQKKRNANGGSGSIGTELDGNRPTNGEKTYIGTTESYNASSVKLAQDYNDLVKIRQDLNNFYASFKESENKLLLNWKAGSCHTEAVTAFNKFSSNYDNYNDVLSKAINALGIASGNIDLIKE